MQKDISIMNKIMHKYRCQFILFKINKLSHGLNTRENKIKIANEQN